MNESKGGQPACFISLSQAREMSSSHHFKLNRVGGYSITSVLLSFSMESSTCVTPKG